MCATNRFTGPQKCVQRTDLRNESKLCLCNSIPLLKTKCDEWFRSVLVETHDNEKFYD